MFSVSVPLHLLEHDILPFIDYILKKSLDKTFVQMHREINLNLKIFMKLQGLVD